MLTAKQEVLSRLMCAYIDGHSELPSPSTIEHLKDLAHSVIEYGKGESPVSALSGDTPVGSLSLGARARQCLAQVAKDVILCTEDELNAMPASSVNQHLFEDEMSAMRNVGATTINEIKQKFALCGLAVAMTRPGMAPRPEGA